MQIAEQGLEIKAIPGLGLTEPQVYVSVRVCVYVSLWWYVCGAYSRLCVETEPEICVCARKKERERIYICMCVCVCIYIYIYIHTHTHRHVLMEELKGVSE